MLNTFSKIYYKRKKTKIRPYLVSFFFRNNSRFALAKRYLIGHLNTLYRHSLLLTLGQPFLNRIYILHLIFGLQARRHKDSQPTRPLQPAELLKRLGILPNAILLVF